MHLSCQSYTDWSYAWKVRIQTYRPTPFGEGYKSCKESEYSVRKWRSTNLFTSVRNVKEGLKHDFANLFGSFSEEETEVGYLQPGHGCKGRQHLLVDDSDLTDMYKIYEGEKRSCYGYFQFLCPLVVVV